MKLLKSNIKRIIRKQAFDQKKKRKQAINEKNMN